REPRVTQAQTAGYRRITSGVGMSGRPQPGSNVPYQSSARSPTGREPSGDGAPGGVGDRESRPQGEGGQVDRSGSEPGRRNAGDVVRQHVGSSCERGPSTRPPENPATGEPYAWKLARTVRRGADGKGRL